MTLIEKKCLITGATSGLGLHSVGSLARAGWRVIATGRQSATSVQLPGGVSYIEADLSDENAVIQLADGMNSCPDLVVHCAVAYPNPELADNARFDGLSQLFRVNAFAPFLLSNELLVKKKPDQFSCFVFVNSEAIFSADTRSGPYAASKAALRILASAFADRCRGQNAASTTLLLGPLANPKKIEELSAIAERRSSSVAEITKLFLRKSNPRLVIDNLLDFDACAKSISYLADLGPMANGMVLRLDGGSAGSLI